MGSEAAPPGPTDRATSVALPQTKLCLRNLTPSGQTPFQKTLGFGKVQAEPVSPAMRWILPRISAGLACIDCSRRSKPPLVLLDTARHLASSCFVPNALVVSSACLAAGRKAYDYALPSNTSRMSLPPFSPTIFHNSAISSIVSSNGIGRVEFCTGSESRKIKAVCLSGPQSSACLA